MRSLSILKGAHGGENAEGGGTAKRGVGSGQSDCKRCATVQLGEYHISWREPARTQKFAAWMPQAIRAEWIRLTEVGSRCLVVVLYLILRVQERADPLVRHTAGFEQSHVSRIGFERLLAFHSIVRQQAALHQLHHYVHKNPLGQYCGLHETNEDEIKAL